MIFFVENEVDAMFDFDPEKIAKEVCEAVLKEEGCPYDVEINMIITDDDGIHEMNREFRNIDNPTDVLSFPMYERNEISTIKKQKHETILGDILISIPKVQEQAIEYEHSFKRELAYMVVHGFYHLMGLDHMNEDEKKEMREKEENILNKLNIIN